MIHDRKVVPPSPLNIKGEAKACDPDRFPLDNMGAILSPLGFIEHVTLLLWEFTQLIRMGLLVCNGQTYDVQCIVLSRGL